MPTWVLGIGASHNGGAALLRDGELAVAIQEERLSRVKRARLFPAFDSLAMHYCLEAEGITLSDVSLVAVACDEPASRPDFDISRNSLWPKSGELTFRYVGHHRAHAAGAAFQSGASETAVLVIDGLGSPSSDLVDDELRVATQAGWETMSIYRFSKGRLECLRKDLVADRSWMVRRPVGMPLFAGIGGMYSAASHQIFGNYLEAGKVMGLAPLGHAVHPPEDFLTVDGETIRFHDTVPAKFAHDQRWPACDKDYRDLAASVQQALEVAVMWAADLARTLSGLDALVLTGGVALNCITNERLIREGGYSDVFVMPAAEDSGLAVGAAVAAAADTTLPLRARRVARDGTGRTYTRSEVAGAIASCVVAGAPAHVDAVEVAELLASGKTLGWFSGSSELGPRALGQRSILCDPRDHRTQDRLNTLKGRELFRPLAPIVLAELASDWFDMGPAPLSPFMLRVCPILEHRVDQIPAVSHVDGTARVQTVERRHQPELYDVLAAFHAATGVPVLVNTSFNAAGEPIVETPDDAFWCAHRLKLGYVVAEGLAVPILSVPPGDAVVAAGEFEWVRRGMHPAGGSEVEVATPWGPTRYWLTREETVILEGLERAPRTLSTESDERVVEHLRRRRLVRIVADPASDGFVLPRTRGPLGVHG